MKNSEAETIEMLLFYLSQHGGMIVSTAELSTDEINQARASKRLYVDNNSLGYVWLPEVNVTSIDYIRKWYPLNSRGEMIEYCDSDDCQMNAHTLKCPHCERLKVKTSKKPKDEFHAIGEGGNVRYTPLPVKNE